MIQLLHGDCLEVMRGIPDHSIDAIIADLPYGTTACSWDAVIPFEPLWAQYKRVIKPAGAVVLFGSQPFTAMLIASNLKWFKYCWTWEKERGTGFQFANYQPLRIVEEICVFYNESSTYNPQLQKVKPYKHALPIYKSDSSRMTSSSRDEKGNRIYKMYDTAQPVNLLKFPRDPDKGHPTQKPVALMEYLVRTYTNAGETVLDNTMGSGTTGVACVNTNRRFIGMELDERWFAEAQRRIAEAQMQPALFTEAA